MICEYEGAGVVQSDRSICRERVGLETRTLGWIAAGILHDNRQMDLVYLEASQRVILTLSKKLMRAVLLFHPIVVYAMQDTLAIPRAAALIASNIAM